ncbi:MAG: homocysteine biosynthesis protein [Vulcanibacillus sp.]
MRKSYEEINNRIKEGKAVVVTAEEIISIVKEKGIEQTLKEVDVVTTATFSPMCSSGAFLNFGHSDPPIRMEKITLNGVSAYSGLAAVDTYIGATEPSERDGIKYAGSHVICDLIDGKPVHLKASSNGTDCYPRKEIDTSITLDSINEAYLFSPRNCYQNYAAATNSSNKTLYTYMGILNPNMDNITYCTSGELSPLVNDPYYRTIGIGTRIFIGGAQGFISWQGTQFNTSRERSEKGIPLGPAATLAVIGDLRMMNTNYIKPAVIENYGASMYVGIGIPIPILDEEMLRHVIIENKDIYTSVFDYSVQRRERPVVCKVNYEQLRSGFVEINGKNIRTNTLSSLYKSREIANKLKELITNGEFMLQEPIQKFPVRNNGLKSLEVCDYEKKDKVNNYE